MALTQLSSAPAAGTNIVYTWGGNVSSDIANLIADVRVFTMTYAASLSYDLNNGRIQKVVLTGNPTISFANPPSGNNIVFFFIAQQDATGSRNITWPGSVLWSNGGIAPTLTTTPNKYDVFGFIQVGAASFIGVPISYNS